ncbi:MAG: ATP-binding cassette domain-containing protein, partial [Planctomycetota bacterium]
MTQPANFRTVSSTSLEAGITPTTAPEGKQVLVRIRDLHRRFGSRHILRGISLDVYKGETLVILGGSGSGKTTLLRHLMAMLRPEEGEVTLKGVADGKDL